MVFGDFWVMLGTWVVLGFCVLFGLGFCGFRLVGL